MLPQPNGKTAAHLDNKQDCFTGSTTNDSLDATLCSAYFKCSARGKLAAVSQAAGHTAT
jgi:hypothetical protein